MGWGDGGAADGRAGRARSPPVPARRPPNRSTAYLAVGIVGMLVFLVGVWEPAWTGVPGGVEFGFGFAILGGVLVVAGFTSFWRNRNDRRRPPLDELFPGVEVYDPRAEPAGAEPSPPSSDRV